MEFVSSPQGQQMFGQMVVEIAIMRDFRPGSPVGVVGVKQTLMEGCHITRAFLHIIDLKVVQAEAAILIHTDQRTIPKQIDHIFRVVGVQPLRLPEGLDGGFGDVHIFREHGQIEIARASDEGRASMLTSIVRSRSR